MRFNKFCFLLLMAFALFVADACVSNKQKPSSETYSDVNKPIVKNHLDSIGIASHDSSHFLMITDPYYISVFITDLNAAPSIGMYKGSGWNRVTLFYNDTIREMFADKEKFGLSGSGLFYELKPKYRYLFK